MKKNTFCVLSIVAAVAMFSITQSAFAQRKTPEELAQIKAALVSPSQKGLDIDTLTEQEMASATLQQEGTKGYILKNAAGITIRTLFDTDGDGQLDQWGFFKDGVEVYRDIDSDKDKIADQMRWLNTGGTRWGVDSNKDGVIDSWKVISPEEVSEEVVMALATRDVNRFLRVALTADEVKALQCGAEMTQKLEEAVAQQQQAFQKSVQAIGVSENARWDQFSIIRPSTIPAGTDGSMNDMTVYYDALAVIKDGENTAHALLGSMIKIGDVWKVVEAPRPYDGGASASVIVPGQQGGSAGPTNPEIPQITNQIQELEKSLQSAPNAQRAAIYDQIIILRLKVATLFAAEKDLVNRDKWLRDLADFIYAAVTIDSYTAGIEKLQAMSKGLSEGGNSDVAAYMLYRAVESEFLATQKTAPNANAIENYSNRLAKLEQLAKDFPNTLTAAQVQIALISEYEMANRIDDAKKTAEAIKATHPNTDMAKKADGYLRRIDSIGKPFPFEGMSSTGSTISTNQYNGKIVALYFWASWSDPNGNEAAEVKKIQARYEREGLSVVGVNLDDSPEAMQAHVTKYATKWPNIHEPGGQESRPAVDAGVSMPPFFILIGKDGNVVNNMLLLPEDLDRAVFSLTRE